MARELWIQTDSGKNGGQFLIDASTRKPPVVTDGIALQVRLGAFSFDSPLTLSGYSSLVLSIFSSQYPVDDLALVTDSVLAASVTSPITLSAWNNRVAWNAEWNISAPSMSLLVGEDPEQDFWMVITGISGATVTVLGSSRITVIESNSTNRPGVGWRGAWAEDTVYAYNDVIKNADGFLYIALTGHTSTTDTEPTSGADWEDVWEAFLVPEIGTAIPDGAVTNAKLANMTQATIKGRASGAGSGAPTDLTATQVRTILNVEDGATADQSGAEIKALYEAEADTNAFTDAEKTKLSCIAESANNYSHPNHTGDVTSSGDGATTIANDAVTNAKAANMAESTIKGRASGAGTGDPTDLSASQVRTILNVADGANNYTLPVAGTSTIGGVKRNTGTTGQYVSGVDTDGSLMYGTPSGTGVSNPSVAYVRSTGDDGTAVIGNPGFPYLNAQTAFNAGARSLDLGVGSFSISFESDVNSVAAEHVHIVGRGPSLTDLVLNWVGNAGGESDGAVASDLHLSSDGSVSIELNLQGGDAMSASSPYNGGNISDHYLYRCEISDITYTAGAGVNGGTSGLDASIAHAEFCAIRVNDLEADTITRPGTLVGSTFYTS